MPLLLGFASSVALLCVTFVIAWPFTRVSENNSRSTPGGASLLEFTTLDVSYVTERMMGIDANDPAALRRAGLFYLMVVDGKRFKLK